MSGADNRHLPFRGRLALAFASVMRATAGRNPGIVSPHCASAFALCASADLKPAIARAASEGGALHAGYNNSRFARFRISAAVPKRHGGARSQVVTGLTKAPSFSDAIVTTSPT